MDLRMLFPGLLACALLACPAIGREPPAANLAPLAFRIDEGRNLNSFLRDGPVAAHLLLRSGTEPRILVAFPAGNSGVGLWFESTAEPVTWTLIAPPRALRAADGQRRPLYGIEFEVLANAGELRPRAAVLSSIRVLRDYELQRQVPQEVRVEPRVAAQVSWTRDRLDGAAGYQLHIAAAAGTRVSADRFSAARGKPLRLKIQALSGETPLTPLPSLLTSAAADDPRLRNALAFLSYREKFLAGSWRFDTYFGRDTLMAALLLADVLEPSAVDSAITSVLDRLAPDGEIAHEEDIGEFAVLRNAREGRGRVATPIYDYGMVDDDFMLAPLAARWLSGDRRAHAREFLGSTSGSGELVGAALARNLVWLVERTTAFAADPRATNLVGIKAGRRTGNWRDSEQGLGGGRYPYDVNAALAPAALEAVARLAESHLLDEFMDEAQRRVLSRARAAAQVWASRAAPLFEVEIPNDRAQESVAAYAKKIGVEGEGAARSLGSEPLQFHAVSLDERGKPVPILNSDEGYRLLLMDPPAQEIARVITALMRPFPAGLITDAGMLVANPAFVDGQLQDEFSRFAYHGAVIWSWQQALLAAGLERQLRRADLPVSLRTRLVAARTRLWGVIGSAREMRTSELWSWSFANGRYHAEPFGRPGADVDESNAAQLWSTVYLAVPPPFRTGTSPGN